MNKTSSQSSYSPSPPATIGDQIDRKTRADVSEGKLSHNGREYFTAEMILRWMRRAYQSIGEKAFQLYQWSPYSAAAIEAIKKETGS